MLIVEVCERMGWTYCEYMNQPTWFTDLILHKLEVDARKEERRIKSKR